MRFIAEHADRTDGGLRWGADLQSAVRARLPDRPVDLLRRPHQREPPSRRELRDAQLKDEIARVHAENYGVYGARKMWLALNREGTPVARCTVERLMRELGLAGARRGRRHRTTIADAATARPSDLVGRRFNPPAPNRT